MPTHTHTHARVTPHKTMCELQSILVRSKINSTSVCVLRTRVNRHPLTHSVSQLRCRTIYPFAVHAHGMYGAINMLRQQFFERILCVVTMCVQESTSVHRVSGHRAHIRQPIRFQSEKINVLSLVDSLVFFNKCTNV